MAKHGKGYNTVFAKVDREREYEPREAIALVKECTRAKFDETVEVHIRTGLNVRHAEEQLRSTIALPHGLGKDVKIKSGKVEYRTDRSAIVHLSIGKASFPEQTLLENYAAVIEEIIRAKPSVAKGKYLKNITVTSTMGPGIKVDSTRTKDIAEAAPAGSTQAETDEGDADAS